jgi:hypothetical protein
VGYDLLRFNSADKQLEIHGPLCGWNRLRIYIDWDDVDKPLVLEAVKGLAEKLNRED